MNKLMEMAVYIDRLSRLMVKAIDCLHTIADGNIDNPQRLAKKTLKHLLCEFKELQNKSEKKLTPTGR